MTFKLRVGGGVFFLLLLLSLFGCEQNPNGDDKCTRGVMSEDGTICVNATDCEGDHNKCLENYVCRENSCVEAECYPGKDCPSGTCNNEEGKCVSLEYCTVEEEAKHCIPSEFCLGGKCEPRSQCVDVQCDVKIPKCARQKASCIEAETCQQSQACRLGRYCDSSNKCKDDLCYTSGPQGGEVTCDDGGICDPTKGECVNAQSCDSQEQCIFDANTKQGSVCVDGICKLYNKLCDATCRMNSLCTIDFTVQDPQMRCSVDPGCKTTYDCKKTEYCSNGSCTSEESQCVDDAFEDNNDYDHATDFDTHATDGELGDLTFCKKGSNWDVDYFVINDVSAYLKNNMRFVLTLRLDPESVGREVNFDVEVYAKDSGSIVKSVILNGSAYDTNKNRYKDKIEFVSDLSTMSNLEKLYIRVSHNSTASKSDLPIKYSLAVNARTNDELKFCKNAQENKLVFEGTDERSSVTIKGKLEGDPKFSKAHTFKGKCDIDTGGTIPEVGYTFEVKDQPKVVEIDVKPEQGWLTDPIILLVDSCEEGKLLENQEAKLACVDEKTGNSTDPDLANESFKMVLQPGTYTVAVTAKSIDTIGAFELRVTQRLQTCKPLAVNKCTNSDRDYEVCDVYNDTILTGSCKEDQKCHDHGDALVGCTGTLGVSCDKPHVFKKDAPFSFNVDIEALENVPENGNVTFTCGDLFEEDDVSGREIYFKAVVPAGHLARLKLQSLVSDLSRVAVYTIKGCGATQCESGQLFNFGGISDEHIISYQNKSTDEEEIYFVIDRKGVGRSKFQIDAEVLDNTGNVLTSYCVPGQSECVNAGKSSEIKVCKPDGSGYESAVKCAGEGICQEVTRSSGQKLVTCDFVGDSCSNPYVMKSKDLVTFNFDDFSNKVKARTKYGSCGSMYNIFHPGGTTEIVFAVEAEQDDLIHIEAAGDVAVDGVILYPVESTCDENNNGCTGGERFPKDAQRIDYVVPKNGKYYFALEQVTRGTQPPESNNVTVFVDVRKPGCSQRLSKPSCTNNNRSIRFCDVDDYEVSQICDKHCDDSDGVARCVGGNEVETSGCIAPKAYLDGSVSSGKEEIEVSNTLGVNHFVLDAGFNNECSYAVHSRDFWDFTPVENATKGPDFTYAFKIPANKKLEYKVDVESTKSEPLLNSVTAYILTDSCSVDSCRNLRGGSGLRTKWQSYYPRENDEIVYLVVDMSNRSYSASKINLEWRIVEAGTNSDTLNSYCKSGLDNEGWYVDVDGTKTEFVCPTNSKCKYGACTPIIDSNVFKGDTCADAQLIDIKGKPYLVAFDTDDGDGTHGLLTKTATPTCNGQLNTSDASGTDYFVKVKVPNNHILSVRGMSGSLGKPVVYIFEDCTDLTTDKACLVSDVGSSDYRDGSALTQYFNESGSDKEVYVGLDSKRGVINCPLGATWCPDEVVKKTKEVFYYLLTLAEKTSVMCAPNHSQCIDKAGVQTQQTCVQGKWVDERKCRDSCDTSGLTCNNKDDKYTNAIDIQLDTTIKSISGNLENLSDLSASDLKKLNMNSRSLVYGSCPFAHAPVGPDVYYKLNGFGQSKVLRALLAKPKTMTNMTILEDGFMLYLVKEESGKLVCMTLSESNGINTLKTPLYIEFQAFQDGNYYLVVDNRKKKLDGKDSNFELYYTIDELNSGLCLPHASQCENEKKLSVCNSIGNRVESVQCPYGCVGRACLVKSNSGSFDTCSAATTPFDKSVRLLYDHDDSGLSKEFDLKSCYDTKSNTDAKNDIFVPLSLKANDQVFISEETSYRGLEVNYYIESKQQCELSPPTLVCEVGSASRTLLSSKINPGLLYKAPSTSSTTDTYLGVTPHVQSESLGNSQLLFINKLPFVDCNSVNKVTCEEFSSSSARLTYCYDGAQFVTECGDKTCVSGLPVCDGTSNRGDTPFDPIRFEDTQWTVDTATNTKSIKVTYDNDETNRLHPYYNGITHACASTSPADGVDMFWEVTLNPNEKLYASVYPWGIEKLQIMLLDGDEAQGPDKPYINNSGTYPTCYAFKDKGMYKSEINYEYTGTVPKKFIVAVDGKKPSSKWSYKMDFVLKITSP